VIFHRDEIPSDLLPYFVRAEIGLEPTPDEFVAAMVGVFREVRRVLRDDGTLWLNLGDSYNNSDKWGGGGNVGKNTVAEDGTVPSWQVRAKRPKMEGLKPKDLIGIPWRVAFALQADGWYLRQDIIWSKPNPMPESVQDRCTKAHEYIFMLSKSPRYYYDIEAIKEPMSLSSVERLGQDVESQSGSARVPGKTNGNMKAVGKIDKQRGHGRRHAGFNDRWDAMEKDEQCSGMRNKRSVWTVATQPFSEAHFATFPPSLIEPCILAGTPAGGVVLDPFGGAGTTGLVADRLQRDAILIELNPEYATMAERRIFNDAPLFAVDAA
jgi:DNA modification methylase